jgi:hypothetical protein
VADAVRLSQAPKVLLLLVIPQTEAEGTNNNDTVDDFEV